MKKYFSLLIVSFVFLFVPLVIVAQDAPSGKFNNTSPSGVSPNTPPSGTFTNTGPGITIQNPLGNIKDFPTLIKKLFDALLPIGVAISVLFIVWAGFKFVWAQGKPTELAVARKNFLYTIIGIGIFLAAWSISNVVWNTIKGLQGSNSPFN